MRMVEAVVVSGEKGMEVELVPEEEEEKNKEKTEEKDDECTEMAVRWEEFLPRMVLRVLLVETDDSTRQIIAALLRKCSYRVAAVADGLKAWETLKRKAPDIDLILTEVELPSISGFALLTLIMDHDICKNIPVIMMSSNDSISMALKCMLKGAADFLIKPVRRNELSNLWQHVWRRHGISKPPQKLTYAHKKLEASSENIAASNDSSGSVASPKENNNCSEKGSEAQEIIYKLGGIHVISHRDCMLLRTLLQCSSTSLFLEAESLYMPNMQGPSQPMCRNSSNLSNINYVKHEKALEFEGGSVKHKNKTDETSMSKTATYNKSINSTDNRQEGGHDYAKTQIQEGILRSELSRYDPSNNTEIHDTENELAEPCGGAIDLIATFKNLPKNIDENSSLLCDGTNKFDFDPKLELSLRGDVSSSSCKQTTEERKTLNHSNASAFSWYSGGKLLQPHFSTPLSSSAKTNTAEWNSNGSSKLSGNVIDTSQQDSGTDHSDENRTTLVIGRSGQVETQMQNGQRRCSAIGVTSDHMSKEHDQVFASMFSTKSGIHPIWSPEPACQKENSPFPTNASYQSNPECHNSEQRHHWPGDATYTSDQTAKDKSNSDPVRHSYPAAGPGTSNSLCHDVANHITSDAHGSMGSKSDGNATSTTAVENTPEIFSDSGRQHYDTFRGMDSHRSSEREAALTKFRLKRKDRCFEKKVRYQSRKRLAEQRPRVKGQFVRQIHNDHPVADAGGGS